MKAAIISKFRTENTLAYEPNQIIAGAGAKQLIFNAFFATLDDGDEVVIPAPYWVSYPDMIRLAGGTPVAVETSRANRWILQPEELERAITPKTKWVILNSPSNPTGAIYTREELLALAEVLKRHPDVLIMADDIYEHVTYGPKFFTIAQVAPELADRTLTINGVSKGYSMTGWRLGYAGGPAWLVSAMEMLQSQSTAHPSSISQAAAVAALEGGHGFMDDWLAVLSARRAIAMDMVKASDGLEADIPEGAFYVFADCRGLLGRKTPDGKTLETDLDFAGYLLDVAHVGVVHGAAFGMPGHIRFAYAVDTETLRGACARVVEAVSKLRT